MIEENTKNITIRYDLNILHSLRKIIRAVDLHSRKLKSDYDITAPQLVCLLTVKEYAPISMAQLAKEVHLSPSTLVGIVDRLEKKNWIKRKRGVKDRRQMYLYTTQEGDEFYEKAPSPLQGNLAGALAELSELEQATISLSLEQIVKMMDAEEIDFSCNPSV